jgi:hypothetical protein
MFLINNLLRQDINKLRNEGYLKLICRCLLNEESIELIRMRFPYEEITYVYGKIYMFIV